VDVHFIGSQDFAFIRLYLRLADYEVVHPDKACTLKIDGFYLDGCPGQLLYLASCDWPEKFVSSKSVEYPTDKADNHPDHKSAEEFGSYVDKSPGFIAKCKHMR